MDERSIALIPAAREDEPILAKLLELYAHDFSEFRELELGEDGRFGYPHLPLYWSEPGRHPFLVRLGGKLAGLVLVTRGPSVSGGGLVWDMAEFFVVRGHRRRGLGNAIAQAVWKLFPGWWEVRVMEANAPAAGFWPRAIANCTGEAVDPIRFEKNGIPWNVFRFEAKANR